MAEVCIHVKLLQKRQQEEEFQYVQVHPSCSCSRRVRRGSNTITTRATRCVLLCLAYLVLSLLQQHPSYFDNEETSSMLVEAQRFPSYRRGDDNGNNKQSRNFNENNNDDGASGGGDVSSTTIDDDDYVNTNNNNNNNNDNVGRNLVLELKQQGWQLVAHRSEFSADELAGVSPSHQVDALLPTTSFGEITDTQVCEAYDDGTNNNTSTGSNNNKGVIGSRSSSSSSSGPPTLPAGSHSSFERPFRNLKNNLATEIMFRTGDKLVMDQMYAVADYMALHEALTNDVVDSHKTADGQSATTSSSSSTSTERNVLPDGSVVTKVDFWFHDPVGRMYYTPGYVHNRRSLHLVQAEEGDASHYYDNTKPMGPLITLDARHIGGLGSIVLLWGDSRDIEDSLIRQQLLDVYAVDPSDQNNNNENSTTVQSRTRSNSTSRIGDDDAIENDDITNDTTGGLILLSEKRNGINVLVRGNIRSSDDDESEVGLMHRNPLVERGWELVAHVSSRGTSHKSFFGGNAALMPNYRYNAQHATWAPHPSTPDFALPFPSTDDVCIASVQERADGADDADEWELMFVTGDSSLWVLVQRYDELRQIIDAKESDYLPNFDFIVGFPDEGIVQKTRGNILSKPPTLSGRGRTRESSEFADGSPWISFEGSHMYGVRHQRIIWGEDNDEGLVDDGGRDNFNSIAKRDTIGSSRGQQQTGYTSLKTKRGGINVYVRRRALWEREQEKSAIAGGYYYIKEEDKQDAEFKDYQGFFPCRKNDVAAPTDFGDGYGYVDANDRTGGQGEEVNEVIGEPLVPGEDGERSATAAPTLAPTLLPTFSPTDDAADYADGRLNGGIVVLDPNAPSTESGNGNGDDIVKTDDAKNSDELFKAKVYGGAAASAVVFGVFLGCFIYRYQRECLRRRRSGHRGPSWGRKVQMAAGAIVTQSKRYFDIFGDDDDIDGVRMKPTFDVESGDEVSSIGTPVNLSNTSDDRSSVDDDDDVSPNRRNVSRSSKKNKTNNISAARSGNNKEGVGGGADDSLATFDDDYYPANIGYGNETVVSSVGGTYGTGTVRGDGNTSQFDNETLSRGGTVGTIFPGLNGMSSVGAQSFTGGEKNLLLRTADGRIRKGIAGGDESYVPGPEDILRKRLKEEQREKEADNLKDEDDVAVGNNDANDIFICEFTVASEDEASFEDQFLKCSSQDTPEIENRKKKIVDVPDAIPKGIDPISYYTGDGDLPPASFETSDDLCASSSSSDDDDNGFFAPRSDSQNDFYDSQLVLSQSISQDDTIDILKQDKAIMKDSVQEMDGLQVQTGAEESRVENNGTPNGSIRNVHHKFFTRSPKLQRRKQRTEGRAMDNEIKSPQTPRLSNLQQKKKIRSPSPSGHPASVTIPSTASTLQRSKSEGARKLGLSFPEISGTSIPSTVGVSSPRLTPKRPLLPGQRDRSNGSSALSADKESIPLAPDMDSPRDVSGLDGLPVFRRASSGLRLVNKPIRSQSMFGFRSDGSMMKPLGPPSLSWVTTKKLEDVEVLDVQVGPGRLGVVLENNPFVAPGEKGPPIFASIKESSVVTNMILPNDALVRVDDEDCTQLDAIHVSKLIKRKQNSFRKLTIVRNHHDASGSDSISGESSNVSDLGADDQARGNMKETSPT